MNPSPLSATQQPAMRPWLLAAGTRGSCLTLGAAQRSARLYPLKRCPQMGCLGVVGGLFSLLNGTVRLSWPYFENRGSLPVVPLFHAGLDAAHPLEASSPVVIDTAGALSTRWGLAVVLRFGPRRLASRRKQSS